MSAAVRRTAAPRPARSARAFALAVALAVVASASADFVVFRGASGERTVEGNVVAEDARGLILEGRDSQHYSITKDELVRRRKVDQPAAPYTKQQLRAELLAEFGPRFQVLATNHYMLVYSSTPDY
ncbi:MAG: hypothetical protein ACRC1K_13295, partial [Planctomycetia bacterium]